MRIWLDQVREEPFQWKDTTENVAVAALDCPELLKLGPVTWRGQVVFTDPGFYLRAQVSYEQTLACIRCLAPIHLPTKTDVELMIAVERPSSSSGGAASHGEHELNEEELGTIYLTEEILDTAPILIEQLQLNVPMKPLCKPDCKGLCPVCGIDRNTASCTCAEQSTDPRWGPLAKLKGQFPGEPA